MGQRLHGLRDFLAELKRRRVYRTAVLYVVLAAGTVEIVDIVLPYTRLPQETVGVLFGVAVAAFPVVLVLAWTFDVSGRLERTAGPETGTGGGTATAPGTAAGRTTDERVPETAEQPPAPPHATDMDPRSVAVLPFDNLSGAEEVDPLAAGLHDDLLTALSKVPGLTVISRTSVKAYRGTETRVAEIARELNVGTILEGAVQSAGGRVRLNVQLIDAGQDVHRWAETYDRELSAENIFRIQSDLSRRIADSLHAELAPAEPGALEGPATDDLEAYRLYAQGLTWLDQRTESGLVRALSYFERAIERDRKYALAWAGLAEAVTLMEWYDYGIPPDAPDPWDAARKARELDPTLAEAHTSLGILHSHRQDGPAALQELTRAVELRPGYAEAQIWLAWLYLVLGRAASSLEPVRRSVELNPLSPVVRIFAAETLLANDRATDALTHSRRAREIQPDFGLAHFMDAIVRYHLGQLAEARAALDETLSLIPATGNPTHAQVRGVRALTHAAAGKPGEARRELDRIREADSRSPDPFALGLAHAALGERDAALDAFGRVARWRSLMTEQIRYFFPDVLGPAREDPRFREVLAAVDGSWQMG